MNSATFVETQNVLRQVFDNDDLELTRELTANDVDEWDSLTHVQIIVSLEKRFGIKFKTSEIVAFKNVGELLDLIDLKLRLKNPGP